MTKKEGEENKIPPLKNMITSVEFLIKYSRESSFKLWNELVFNSSKSSTTTVLISFYPIYYKKLTKRLLIRKIQENICNYDIKFFRYQTETGIFRMVLNPKELIFPKDWKEDSIIRLFQEKVQILNNLDEELKISGMIRK